MILVYKDKFSVVSRNPIKLNISTANRLRYPVELECNFLLSFLLKINNSNSVHSRLQQSQSVDLQGMSDRSVTCIDNAVSYG